MFLKPPKESTDQRIRSLLQKSVRRGFLNTVRDATILLDQKGDKTWLRSRTIVITFEECWPLASNLNINSNLSTRLDSLLKVAKSTKQKDAAGLGALAYAYFEGDRDMLDCVPNPEPLKLISGALQRPTDYFDWIINQSKSEQSKKIIFAAQKYLAAATWQWDKACILAGALLSTYNYIPQIEELDTPNNEFPYWTALDKHTPQGKVALKKVAAEMNLKYRQLLWASFYFESAQVNKLHPSEWWEAEKKWRLKKAGLSIESAEKLWLSVRDTIQYNLKDESDSLKNLIERTANNLNNPDNELRIL